MAGFEQAPGALRVDNCFTVELNSHAVLARFGRTRIIPNGFLAGAWEKFGSCLYPNRNRRIHEQKVLAPGSAYPDTTFSNSGFGRLLPNGRGMASPGRIESM
jgi:hypothetical protein